MQDAHVDHHTSLHFPLHPHSRCSDHIHRAHGAASGPHMSLSPCSDQDLANTCFCYLEPGHCTWNTVQTIWHCIKDQSSAGTLRSVPKCLVARGSVLCFLTAISMSAEHTAAVTVTASNCPHACIICSAVTCRTPNHLPFRACISRAANPTPLPRAKFIYKGENTTLEKINNQATLNNPLGALLSPRLNSILITPNPTALSPGGAGGSYRCPMLPFPGAFPS